MPTSEQSYPLTDIKGKEYLEVKYRIDWLRKDHPDADITTTIYSMDSSHAVVTCRVTIPSGGSATGSAMEEVGRFPFLEKAETSAIGRALGALGYGTLQCLDFDEEPTRENAKLADSPVQRQQSNGNGVAPQNVTRMQQGNAVPAAPPRQQSGGPLMATEPQIKAIYAIARGTLALDDEETNALCWERYKVDVKDLGRRDASAFIDAMKTGTLN